MAGFPWSELGLDGPADQSTIRRAYAARLKIVRPDVDPAGFQRLVQARDAALRAIELTAQRPLLRQTPPSDPVPKRAELAPENRPTQPDNKPPAEMPPPLDIELSAGSASSAAKQPPQLQPRLVTIDVDPHKSPPAMTEPGAKPPSAMPVVVDRAQVVADQATVLILLSAFVEAWSKKQFLPSVAPILELLGEQSIVARQKLEIDALRAVATLLDKSLFDRKTSKARQKAARSLILGLDDDYAWSSSDRRLYQMMPQAEIDQIVRLLRVVREWEETGLAPKFRASSRQVRERRKPNWALGAIGLLLFAIVRGVSIWTPKSSVTTFTPIVVSKPYVPFVQPNPISATFAFGQGVAYDNKSQFDRAIEKYDEAIRLDPNYALAFYNRALDYANKGEFDRAIEDYNQAIRLNPGNPDNFVSRGAAFDGKGQYDRAIQDYDQAIRLKPDYTLAFVDRGIAYANQEQYDRAIQDYDEAIRLNPNEPDALYYRGLAKRERGDAAGADADIAKARQFNSALPPASRQP